MKKTILLLGAVGVLMMTGCADEGITRHQKKKWREVQII